MRAVIVPPSRGGADSVDGAGDESTHATDNVALIALRRENERLQGELERVKAQAKSAAAAAAPPPPPPAPAAAAAPPPVPAASSEELSALRKSLKKRTQEAESLQADATAAREENAALQARVRELQARLEDVAAGGDANAAASAAAAARVQALEDDKAALQQQLEGAQADAKSQARAHQKQQVRVMLRRCVHRVHSRWAFGHVYPTAPTLFCQADAQQRLDASATKIEELTAETERLQAQQREASAALASAAGEAEALLQKRLVAVEEELQQQKAATQDAQNANQANIEAAQAALATWKEKYTHVKTERKQYKVGGYRGARPEHSCFSSCSPCDCYRLFPAPTSSRSGRSSQFAARGGHTQGRCSFSGCEMHTWVPAVITCLGLWCVCVCACVRHRLPRRKHVLLSWTSKSAV